MPSGSRFWVFLFLICTIIASNSVQLHIRNQLSPFDLGKLGPDEVVFFRHLFGENNFQTKLATLLQSEKTDVFVVGNHMTRALYDPRVDPPYSTFNFVYGNTGLGGTLDFLDILAKHNVLPGKAVVITLLTHGDLAKEIDSDFWLESNLSFSKLFKH